MTPFERKSLAEQLEANPLYGLLMNEIEADAIERMVSARTDTDRMEAQAYVRAVRTFRQDCADNLHNTQPGRGAPA